METTYLTQNLEPYINNFTGRRGHAGFDDTKRYKISELNRDFVWPMFMQVALICSILQGLPIPQIFICDNEILDGGQRSTTIHRFVNGEFPITFNGREFYYPDMRADPVLNTRWLTYQISILKVTGATPEQRAQMYEDFNKGVPLTTGQKLFARTTFPLIAMSMALLNRTSTAVFLFRELLSRVWKSSWNTTKTLTELTFSYQILSASLFGPQYFDVKFTTVVELVNSKTMIDINLNTHKLVSILQAFDNADPDNVVARRIKETIFRKFIGGAIYDFHNMPYLDFCGKWTRFIREAYTFEKNIIQRLLDVGAMRAHAVSRICGVSRNVQNYLDGRGLPEHDDAALAEYLDEDDDTVTTN
jgi:hypothetical protein